MPKFTHALLVVTLCLVVLNIVVLRQLNRLEQRVAVLEKAPAPAK